MHDILQILMADPYLRRQAFAAIFGICVILVYWQALERMRVRQRLAYLTQSILKRERLLRERFLGRLPYISVFDAGQYLQKRAELIGFELATDRKQWARVRLAVLLVSMLLGVMIMGTAGLFIGGAVGWYGPIYYINRRFRQRMERLLKDFPVFSDYLRVYLRTGMNIPQALKHVSTHLEGPMQEEVLRMDAKMEIAGDYEQPFREFGLRCGFPQAAHLAESLIQGWRTGLRTEVFVQQAHIVRTIRQMALKQEIRKAPVRIVAIPGSLAMTNVLLIIGYPFFMQILESIGSITGGLR